MPNPILEILNTEFGIIKSVNIAVLRTPETPIHIRITYDQATDVALPELSKNGVKATGWSRRTDTVRIIQPYWASMDMLEDWISEAAWAYGAKDMARYSKSPHTGDPFENPGWGITHAFGYAVYKIAGEDDVIGTSPERETIINAAKEGYWEYFFHGLKGREKGSAGRIYFKKWLSEGRHLNPDGSRNLPFPGFAEDRLYKIAKEYEVSDIEGQGLRLIYDFDKLKLVWK